jgi:pimeloyl-ACP methyl ester carboxylesterase
MLRRSVAIVAGLASLQIATASAQIAPPRTIDELKAETQARADRNAYPLTGLKPEDVREALANIHSLDRDEWAAAWSAIGDRYNEQGLAASNPKIAVTNFLEAWRYYSFARWPVPNSPGKEAAYQKALKSFRDATRFFDPPVEIVRIPFEGKEIVGYLRLPKDVRPAPLVFSISALDSRKEDSLERGADFVTHGVAVFAVDMPGTGEAPIKAEVNGERMFSRALDALAQRPDIDKNRIAVIGVSWGSYWAAKLAFVERARIKGAVVQGGPVDHYFDADWQKTALATREYLFDLFPARASVYGVTSLEDFLAFGPKLSLKAQGLVDQPSSPMLLVNGVRDTQVPIADLDLLLHTGSAKAAWVNPTGGHMGRSAEWPDGKIFEQVVLPWVLKRLGSEG